MTNNAQIIKPLRYAMFSTSSMEVVDQQVQVYWVTSGNLCEGSNPHMDLFGSLQEAEDFILTLQFSDIAINLVQITLVEFNPRVLR